MRLMHGMFAVVIISALAGCDPGGPQGWCSSAANCIDDFWSETDENNCVTEQEIFLEEAERQNCDSEWRAFTSCRAEFATCDESTDGDTTTRTWGLNGSSVCDEQSSAYFSCME